MRLALAIIGGLLLITLPGVAQSTTSQDKATTDDSKKDDTKKTDKPATSRAQIVGTAEISKIDAKKKVLEVRQVVEANNNSSNSNDQDGPTVNRRNPGGYPGGGGGYPGGGYPGGGYPGGGYPGGRRRGGYPGGGYPGGGRPGPGGQSNQAKQYKVYVTKDTVLKLEDQDMLFTDMHVGDRIIVAGTPKGSGSDLEATTITRKFN